MGRDRLGRPIPSRAAGLTRLAVSAEIIEHYAEARNTVDGATTSGLSPYLRRRLVLEEEVLTFARAFGAFERIDKFVQEVVWRTYWKGWLQHRPRVWAAYLDRLKALDDTFPAADRERLGCATAGRTDLTFFNAWCEELTSTGYLHNHARMWFASVWIFTLKLPWELGARFFLNHLLDGDPASNTLSWRWVAGLQTPGKHYLARAENIARYTNGRWVPKPGELDESAQALPDDGLANIAARPPELGPEASNVRPRAILLHDEDCGPLPDGWAAVPALRYVVRDLPGHSPSQLVAAWVKGAWSDADSRVGNTHCVGSAQEAVDWCRANGVADLWTLRPLTGFVADALGSVAREIAKSGVTIQYADRGHDLTFFPDATKGFFSFWARAEATLRRRWK